MQTKPPQRSEGCTIVNGVKREKRHSKQRGKHVQRLCVRRKPSAYEGQKRVGAAVAPSSSGELYKMKLM